MQTEVRRCRHRGWRQSAPLVDLARAVPTDLARIYREETATAASREPLALQLAALGEDQVAVLQHYRVQIQYRLTQD